MKRFLIVGVALFVLAGIGLALLARSVLTGANVRAAVASQLSAAIGQPVTIGSLGASVYPRVTMDLGEVAIGQPTRIQLASVHVGTGLGALFSRRIEHADVRVEGARITLPLPDLGPARGAASEPASGSSPVEIVSIDEIVLRKVEVMNGKRTLRGDIELVPQGKGVVIRRVALAADDTAIEMTGTLTALSPVAGEVAVTAAALDFDRLVAFLNDFTATDGKTAPSAGGPSAASAIGRLAVALKVGRATTGGLTLSDLAASAVVTPTAVTFDPLTLGVFGGRYEGTMQLALDDVPRFQWRAKVSGIDTATLMAFAGSPNSITGTLSGTIALDGEGLQMEQALRTASGRSRVDITNGTIAGLQLVRTMVTATSGRGGILASAGAAVVARNTAGGERFSRLGATLRLARGVLATDDFSMASTDVDLSASGTLQLASMGTEFAGRAQLSEALSNQAGTDLYRYTQEGGRVTLPVTVTGPIANLSVRVDVGDVAKRAIRNKATEEAKKAIERNLPAGLRGLIPRRPPR